MLFDISARWPFLTMPESNAALAAGRPAMSPIFLEANIALDRLERAAMYGQAYDIAESLETLLAMDTRKSNARVRAAEIMSDLRLNANSSDIRLRSASQPNAELARDVLTVGQRLHTSIIKSISDPLSELDDHQPHAMVDKERKDLPAIAHLEDVAYQIDRTTILAPSTFSIFPRDIVAVTGPNGSGKTTLLELLAGNLKSTEGILAYPNLGRYENHRDQMSQILLVGAGGPIFGHVGMNLLVVSSLNHDQSIENGRTLMKKALRDLGIAHKRHQLVSTLSNGERARYEMAKAFVQEPELLLLDEPLAYLDRESRAAYLKAAKKRVRARPNMAIVMTGQDLETFLGLETRHISLKPIQDSQADNSE